MGQYDRTMKLMVERDPEAMARFVLHEWHKRQVPGTPEIQIASVTLLSEEFQSEELKGDSVWLVEGPEGPSYMASVEYQSTLDPTIPLRSLEYLARARKKHWKTCGKLPVIGVVLFLFDEENMPDCPMCWPGLNDTTVMAYDYLLINLKTLPREEILTLQEPALWPLALLTKGPVDRIIVKDMFADLLEKKLYDILPIGKTVAGWFLRGDDLSWLHQEYRKMYEIFKDSPVTHWIEEDAREDERRKAEAEREKMVATFQQTVIKLVAYHYPKLRRLAKTQVLLLKDPERLQQLILNVSKARDSDETQNVLLSLQENADEKDTAAIEVVPPPSLET
jgi:hypothetical protein